MNETDFVLQVERAVQTEATKAALATQENPEAVHTTFSSNVEMFNNLLAEHARHLESDPAAAESMTGAVEDYFNQNIAPFASELGASPDFIKVQRAFDSFKTTISLPENYQAMSEAADAHDAKQAEKNKIVLEKKSAREQAREKFEERFGSDPKKASDEVRAESTRGFDAALDRARTFLADEKTSVTQKLTQVALAAHELKKRFFQQELSQEFDAVCQDFINEHLRERSVAIDEFIDIVFAGDNQALQDGLRVLSYRADFEKEFDSMYPKPKVESSEIGGDKTEETTDEAPASTAKKVETTEPQSQADSAMAQVTELIRMRVEENENKLTLPARFEALKDLFITGEFTNIVVSMKQPAEEILAAVQSGDVIKGVSDAEDSALVDKITGDYKSVVGLFPHFAAVLSQSEAGDASVLKEEIAQALGALQAKAKEANSAVTFQHFMLLFGYQLVSEMLASVYESKARMQF